jgi:phage terminase large subunit-like protein
MAESGALEQSDPAGNRKLHKSKSCAKIDGSMALAMALGQ